MRPKASPARFPRSLRYLSVEGPRRGGCRSCDVPSEPRATTVQSRGSPVYPRLSRPGSGTKATRGLARDLHDLPRHHSAPR